MHFTICNFCIFIIHIERSILDLLQMTFSIYHSSFVHTKAPDSPPGIVNRQDTEQSCRSQSHHANLPVHHKGHHREFCLLGGGGRPSR